MDLEARAQDLKRVALLAEGVDRNGKLPQLYLYAAVSYTHLTLPTNSRV